jgi:hypothetical protein
MYAVDVAPTVIGVDLSNAAQPAVAETTITRNTGAVTQFSATFKKPDAGDLLKVQFITNGNTVLTPPAGWILRYSNTAFLVKFYVYYRVCDGTEGTSAVWTLTGVAARNAGQCQRITGVDRSTPWDAPDSIVSSNAILNTIVIPGIVTATPRALLVTGVGADLTASTLTGPAGWIEDDDSGGTLSKMQAVAHKTQAAPGDSGPITWTISTTGQGRIGWIGALRPAITSTPLGYVVTVDVAPVPVTVEVDLDPVPA